MTRATCCGMIHALLVLLGNTKTLKVRNIRNILEKKEKS
jgi:hypothetical protein